MSKIIKPKTKFESTWWSAHTHSNFSSLDGMPSVGSIVEKVAKLGQPALGLTEHGNMASAVQLYLSARKHNIVPFPGVEMYLLDPKSEMVLDKKTKEMSLDPKANRFHVGLLSLNLNGYQSLVQAVSLTHTRPRFNRFPRLKLEDLTDLSEIAGDDIALMTGCYFGMVQQTLIKHGEKKAENMVKLYASLFKNTFVEIQNHSITHNQDDEKNVMDDADIVEVLVGIANKLGLPVMATQDSHYLKSEDKKAHSLMKRMVYGGVEDEFPGDSFHIASAKWVSKHYDKKTWVLAEEGAKHLLSLNTLEIPPLDKYKAQIPSVVKNPQSAIEKLCRDAMKSMVSPSKVTKYQTRLDYELEIIKDLGMAGYFMLVYNYVEWCNNNRVCIEARGSANGSLVCYLLGITQVDPIKWNLLFDRFLSRDRIKPPDIDMDVEDVSRDRLVNYLEGTFDTLRIGTWGRLGINDEGKGSVLVSYKTWLTKQTDDPEKRKHIYATVQTIGDVKRYSNEDAESLQLISDMGSVYRSYGTHAGGLLLSGKNQRIDTFVPRMLVASSNMVVSQFDMDDVEKLGLLKLDILGQTTLSVMRDCQEYIGRDNPTDFTWIPDDDSKACAILREGKTENGIFHFEGYTKARGGKQMGIRSTKDAILATGLFMPGAMNTGQTELFLERRRDKNLRDKVKYIHPAFESALKDTYGAVIFQEQVINIMRGLGMSVEGINVFFSIVKTSGAGSFDANNEKLAKMRSEFDELCMNAGISEKNTDKAWEMTAGFVSYGFNRAHATGYGLRSYRCAYLKAYYPLEYMAALLKNWAGSDKEKLYIRECRRINVRILPPDVNISSASWTLDRKHNAIRRGLVSIKGVGVGASENLANNAPYKSIQDLVDRTDSRAVTGGKDLKKMKGVMQRLDDAGALNSLKRGK